MNRVPIVIPVTSMMPMLLRASAPGPGHEYQRHMTEHGGGRGHQHRAQTRHRRLPDRSDLGAVLLLQPVGELDDQNAVLGDQADKGDQADLAVDVDRGEAEKGERQRAPRASGTEPRAPRADRGSCRTEPRARDRS